MAKNELTKAQIESIESYGDSIESIENFVEAVRKMPGMYIGHKGNKGFMNMFREVFQNSVDEIMRADSPCNTITVSFDERSCETVIEDNGRGIPFGLMEKIFLSEHTSSNYTKKKGEYTSGMHGEGAKITNALSSKFVVESYVLGDARRLEFDDGIPWKAGEKKIPSKGRQGTLVYFVPSFEVMGYITTSANDILALIQMLLPLTPIGTRFYFKAIFNDGKETNLKLENKDGISSFIQDICEKPLITPIGYAGDNGDFRANVLICYDTSEKTTGDIIIPFCNFCPTESVRSDHVIGCMNGIKKFFIGYMNRVYLNSIQNGKKKKKNISITESDIRSGLRLVIDAACLEPLFTGQAKEVLSVEGMRRYIEELTLRSLDEWGKTNPQALQKLCKYFKDIAELRADADTKRVKLSNQYASSTSGLPSKYMKPTKKKVELFIVEGDSAKGSFDTYRHNETQGVFPIRGMILNCFEKPEKTCLENAEVAGIIAIIGGGYGKNFNIDKVQWDKIIACFTGDTRVRTLNSETDRMTFEELTIYAQNNPDIDIWVHSCNINTGEFVKAKASNIGIREYTRKIYTIHFDDGGIIKCTPEHEFLIDEGRFIEARNLIREDKIISYDDSKVFGLTKTITKIEIHDYDKPIPMYCMTVNGYENFAVCNDAGGSVITHNCTDADPAGAEIEALLLRLVLRFFPQLILAGKYYKSVAPLYYIGKGKNKKYFTNKIELVEYVQKLFSKSNKISTMKDKVLSASGVQELLYHNIDYILELNRIANRYRINPKLLELFLYNRDKSIDDICKIIKKNYRFMEKRTINNHTVCQGIIDGMSNTIIFDEKLINDCNEIIKIIDSNIFTTYKVNGQICTLLDIMSLYDNYKPSGITHLKGLGEQSGEELAESVILPGDMGNRTLLQYTMDSAMKEIEQIRAFESDKSKLLEGLVVNRLDVVG